jgi:integrase
VRLHDLRHTYALISLENGDDIKTLQQNMGHADIGTTLNTYGHVSERMKEESAARMDARIETLLR